MIDTIGANALIAVVGVILMGVDFIIQDRRFRAIITILCVCAIILLGVLERNALRAQTETAKKEVEATQDRLDKVQNSLDRAEALTASQAESITQLRDQNYDLSDGLVAAKSERTRLLEELGSARKQISTLEGIVFEVRVQNADIAEELLQARRALAEGIERNADDTRAAIEADRALSRLDASAAESRQSLIDERNKYCARNSDVIGSPELTRWGGACCNGQWVSNTQEVCFINN